MPNSNSPFRPRLHYIPEWTDKRNLKQADLVRGTGADKATVSRWFDGALPSEQYLIKIAAVLGCEEPAELFRHPDDDWLARFFRERSDEERQRARATLEAAFPSPKKQEAGARNQVTDKLAGMAANLIAPRHRRIA